LYHEKYGNFKDALASGGALHGQSTYSIGPLCYFLADRFPLKAFQHDFVKKVDLFQTWEKRAPPSENGMWLKSGWFDGVRTNAFACVSCEY
jgi:hypothetical protein